MSGLTAHDAALAGEQREEVSCELWQYCGIHGGRMHPPSFLFHVNLCQPLRLLPDYRAFREKQLIFFIINLSGLLKPISAARAVIQLEKWSRLEKN